MNEVITETPTALTKIIDQSGLDKQKSEYLLEKFNDLVGIAAEWEKRAKEIVVTDESQTDLMKQAREGRLLLKEKRVEVEKTRKQLKDASLNEGRAIDNIAGFIKSLIEPTEKYLDDQEKFAERKAAERRKELQAERSKLIQEYVDSATLVTLNNLGDMPQSQFDAVLLGYKTQRENIIATAAKAEEERIAKEKADAEAREAQRIENERLKQEAEAKAAIRKKRNEELRPYIVFIRDYNGMLDMDEEIYVKELADVRVGAELQWEEDSKGMKRQAQEKTESEARLKEAQDQAKRAKAEQERVARVLQETKDKAEREKQEREEQHRQSELAPDKKKLEDMAAALENYPMPQLKSAKANKLAKDVQIMIATAANHIRTNIKKI